MVREWKLLTIFLFLFFLTVEYGYGYVNSLERETTQKDSYYRAPTKEGWWWYQDPQKKKKEETKREDTTAKQTEKSTNQNFKPLTEYSYEELLYMHPDEFSKLYDFYLKKAVQKPTEESLYEFYNLVDVARKKSLLFAYYAGYVWQKYPDLSTERDVPITGPGIAKRRNLMAEELRRYRDKNASEFGYLVFVQPGCVYCDTQLKILKYAEMDGIPIKIVDISKNPFAKEKFGIEVTPTIIVVDQKTGKYMPVGSGVISLDEMYERTARAIRLITGSDDPARYGIYEFQKGTSLDPLEPSPLWKKNKNK